MKIFIWFLPAIYLIFGCARNGATSQANIPLDLIEPNKIETSKAVRHPDSKLLWFDARNLTVEGKGWEDTEDFYNRLPARAQGKVTDAVWKLSKHTAGICIRFVTDSKKIGAIWDGGGAMYHMAATGNSGLDLYRRTGKGWKFCGVGKPDKTRTTRILAQNLEGAPTEHLLYLALYNKVTRLEIGIEEGAFIAKAPPRPRERSKPIVFYGTSVTQGGCASRCGMCHTAILGRWLDRPVINLGFSGAGKMEPIMAQLLGELDAEIFVLDCQQNMTTEMVRKRVAPFVKTLRKARPLVPILLVEAPYNRFNDPRHNVALREQYQKLKKDEMPDLYYLEGYDLLKGCENGTVDGSHPTDLGFYRMALAFRPKLEELLE